MTIRLLLRLLRDAVAASIVDPDSEITFFDDEYSHMVNSLRVVDGTIELTHESMSPSLQERELVRQIATRHYAGDTQLIAVYLAGWDAAHQESEI